MGEHSIHISGKVVNRSLNYHMYSIIYFVLCDMYFNAFKFRKRQIVTFYKDFEQIKFTPIDKIFDENSSTKFRKSE
jgi:hypothetical protein